MSYFKKNETNAYVSLFGNLCNTAMQGNYIVVDNINYEIFHETDNNIKSRPGGTGFGFGTGTGLKFELTDRILGDLYYNLNYNNTYFTENFQPTNFNHSLGIRLLWN